MKRLQTLPIYQIVARLVACCLAFTTSGCGGRPTEPTAQSILPAAPIVQYRIVGSPRVYRAPQADSALLYVAVETTDSLPHVSWTTSTVLVETSRGYRGTHVLVPFACIEPRPVSGEEQPKFPRNFSWYSCQLVNAISEVVLSADVLLRMLNAVGGQLFWLYPFQARPGAQYVLLVRPGREATEVAMTRMRAISGVTDVFRETAEPTCVYSEVPQPCPRWETVARIPFTYGIAGGGTIPVERGGLVRATYTDLRGHTTTREYQMP
jgi:hypothetical protein